MKKMFLLFSHTLTLAQEIDAKKSLGVDEFVALPQELQELWSNLYIVDILVEKIEKHKKILNVLSVVTQIMQILIQLLTYSPCLKAGDSKLKQH